MAKPTSGTNDYIPNIPLSIYQALLAFKELLYLLFSMIIRILSHVHFQTTLIFWWSKMTTFETQTFGQEIEPQQFQHTNGKNSE